MITRETWRERAYELDAKGKKTWVGMYHSPECAANNGICDEPFEESIDMPIVYEKLGICIEDIPGGPIYSPPSEAAKDIV